MGLYVVLGQIVSFLAFGFRSCPKSSAFWLLAFTFALKKVSWARRGLTSRIPRGWVVGGPLGSLKRLGEGVYSEAAAVRTKVWFRRAPCSKTAFPLYWEHRFAKSALLQEVSKSDAKHLFLGTLGHDKNEKNDTRSLLLGHLCWQVAPTSEFVRHLSEQIAPRSPKISPQWCPRAKKTTPSH